MLRAALLWCMAALPVAAEDQHARLATAYGAWLETQETTGALATGHVEGDVWTVTSAGRSELASVSKSITAACAQHYVEAGALTWSDTVAGLLGKGPEVTAAQLVTHTSGLVRDSTQIAMFAWLDRPVSAAGHHAAQVLDLVAERGVPQGAAGRYHYNNENYALLALLIEQASGQGYYDACWQALGLDRKIGPSPRTGAYGPWGGIVANTGAYLEFFNRTFGPDGAVGSDPFAAPYVEIADGLYYGMGVFFRARGAQFNFWHFGGLCFPGRLAAGSFAVMWEGRASALALYDACIEDEAAFALDQALVTAVYGSGP